MFRGFKALFTSATHADAFDDGMDKNRVAFRSTTDLFDDDLPKPELKENASPAKQSQQQVQQQKQGEPQQLQQPVNNNNNSSKKPVVQHIRSMFASTSGEESLAEALNSISQSRNHDIPDDFAMGSSQPNPDEKDELPELLDDDDTLHRTKELSDFGLIQYLSRDDVLSRLIKIVAKDFDDSQVKDESHDIRQSIIEKYRYKFPYMASELLISTVGKTYLLPKIIEDSPASQKKSNNTNRTFLIDELFSLAEAETIPPHLARHYIKLLMNMGRISSLAGKLMSYIYMNNGKVFKNFVKHTNMVSEDVCEWILMCLLYEREEDDEDNSSSDDDDDDDASSSSKNKSFKHSSKSPNASTNSPSSNGPLSSAASQQQQQQHVLNPPGDLTVKAQVIQLLASYLNKDDYSENVAAVFSTIVSLPRPSPLVELLLKKDQAEAIIESILSSTHSPDIFSEGMDFLGVMVINSQQGDASMQAVLQNLVKFVELLKNPKALQAVTIPSGVINPPLGVYRLKIIEFFVILFKHFEELTQVHSDLNFKGPMIECKFLPTVMELFFNYPSNNILHNLVSHIVMCIIENKYEEFTTILLDDCKIVENIVEAFKANKAHFKKTRTSLGYMGHVTIMENIISSNLLDNEQYKKRIQAIPGWNEFAEQSKERHFIECIYRHGGQTPLPKSYVARREQEDAELKAEEAAEANAQTAEEPAATETPASAETTTTTTTASPTEGGAEEKEITAAASSDEKPAVEAADADAGAAPSEPVNNEQKEQ